MYAHYFGNVKFPYRFGLPGTTGRLDAWCSALAACVNDNYLSPTMSALTLQFLDTPDPDGDKAEDAQPVVTIHPKERSQAGSPEPDPAQASLEDVNLESGVVTPDLEESAARPPAKGDADSEQAGIPTVQDLPTGESLAGAIPQFTGGVEPETAEPTTEEAEAFLDLCEDHEWGQVQEALVAKPRLINCAPGGRWTALMLAAQAGSHDAVSMLLEHGADVHLISRNGSTPLDVAHQDVKELLRSTADLTPVVEGNLSLPGVEVRRSEETLLSEQVEASTGDTRMS
jgi:hypothetical protein